MIVRRDGVGVADVRITYETDDGALLLSRYYGIFDLGPGGYERALRQDSTRYHRSCSYRSSSPRIQTGSGLTGSNASPWAA